LLGAHLLVFINEKFNYIARNKQQKIGLKFYVQHSVHQDQLINKYQQDVTPQYFYFLFCHSLHVAGTLHAHHQEISKLTAYTTSGKTTV
jgi:hypothetical protein